jgi:hypothetical protein
MISALALVIGLAMVGCGGGGGGGNNGGGGGGGGGGGTIGGKLATITGTVTDTGGNPASGVTVAVVGTSLTGVTSATGAYTISSVPLNATQISVTSPDPQNKYYNFGTYNGQAYQFGTGTGACYITLPALSAGKTATLTAIALYPAGGENPPPAPLTNGCPK